MIRRKSLFFGKKDSMNEGIMKPTKKFSNNFSQNLSNKLIIIKMMKKYIK